MLAKRHNPHQTTIDLFENYDGDADGYQQGGGRVLTGAALANQRGAGF